VRAAAIILVLMMCGRALGDDRSDAKAHYKRGLGEYALGNYAEAAKEYEAAFKLVPESALLFNAAQAHRFAGNRERALFLYQNYLRLFEDKIENREEVLRQIERLKAISEPKPHASPAPRVEAAPREERQAAPPLATRRNANKPSRVRPWVWGVVVGGVVAVGLAVGLGVGLGAQTQYPTPGFGTIKVE
jgi:tetratricopeptide (TPR) repeat protein